MKNSFPTPAELAAEAQEALRKRPMEGGDALWTKLIRWGFINSQGQITKLIGGAAEPEPNYENWVPKNGAAK